MLTIAMVLRSGGDYTPEYVRRLCEGIRQHTRSRHRVVCLSDDSTVSQYCEHEPLATDWTGWWSKLELFRVFKGSTLYLDLDTLVVGDITPITEYPHYFTMLSDLLFPVRPASGVMAWSGDFSYLADGFDMSQAEDYRKTECWGDQGWITKQLGFDPARFQDLFPGMIVSRKRSTDDQKRAASIICYHGKPRPHQTGWDTGIGQPQRVGRRA